MYFLLVDSSLLSVWKRKEWNWWIWIGNWKTEICCLRFSLDSRQLSDRHFYSGDTFLVALLAYNRLLCDQQIHRNCNIWMESIIAEERETTEISSVRKYWMFCEGRKKEVHLVFRKRFVRLRFFALPCKSELFGPITKVASTPLSLSFASKSTTSFSPSDRKPPIRSTLFNMNRLNEINTFPCARRVTANLTWCTNTSCDPSSGVMNPQPLVTLNHLHFPRLKSLGVVSSASLKKRISIKRHIFLSFFFCFAAHEWN